MTIFPRCILVVAPLIIDSRGWPHPGKTSVARGGQAAAWPWDGDVRRFTNRRHLALIDAWLQFGPKYINGRLKSAEDRSVVTKMIGGELHDGFKFVVSGNKCRVSDHPLIDCQAGGMNCHPISVTVLSKSGFENPRKP